MNWTTSNIALVVDSNFTTSGVGAMYDTARSQVTGFDFSTIPVGATITGIKADVSRKSSMDEGNS